MLHCLNMEQNNQQPQNNQQQNQGNSQPIPTNQPPQKPVEQKPAPVVSSPAPKNKNLLLSGVIIVIVLALLVATPRLQKNAEDSRDSNENREEVASVAETPSTAITTRSKKTLTRAEAQIAYANKMIEVTGDCSITPYTLTQPKGTTILLDNNTAKPHTVTVGKKTYRISPYHYTLSWLNVDSGTLSVTCDGKDEGATVVVQ